MRVVATVDRMDYLGEGCGIRCVFASWVALVGLCIASAGLAADDPNPGASSGFRDWLDNDFYKIHLDVRPRVELTDFDGLSPSQAYTIRFRLGIGTKPLYGFSAYAEMESSLAAASGQYFDTVEGPTGQSPIADPEETALNQAYLLYESERFPGSKLKGGRQRIILDDARFVGNVGWRQNEQTYDAIVASTAAGIDGLSIEYGYLWNIRRIFGDDGSRAQRDFNSESHLVRVAYDAFPVAKVTLFAYLLDFERDSPANASNSYGFRVTGGHEWGDAWSIGYAGSFAFQTETARNPVSYEAIYGAIELEAGYDAVGRLRLGYEHLGSDDGRARFVTPLATAHKFNGFADAFLDNGGVNGLEDLYVAFAPRLPWKLKGQVIYHHFWSDEGSRDLGQEIDAVISRPILPGLVALVKFAWFDGRRVGPANRWRQWFQLTYTY